MSIGDLRKRVTLQSESLTADGLGGQVANWVTIANLWTEMRPFMGREAVSVASFNKRITHQFLVRYRTDILTGMRLLLNNRQFLIRAVVNQSENNQWLELMAEEGGTL